MKEIYIKFREIPPDDLLRKYNVAVDRKHKAGFANDERLLKNKRFMHYVEEWSEVDMI